MLKEMHMDIVVEAKYEDCETKCEVSDMWQTTNTEYTIPTMKHFYGYIMLWR